MELYHIHILGNHDELYKVNHEFVVNKNSFNNRIYDRVHNMTPTVDVDKYPEMVRYLNTLLIKAGVSEFDARINLGELIELFLQLNTLEDDPTRLDLKISDKANLDLVKLLKDAKTISLTEGINIRELALEEYRKENCNSLPSRMHSLFACSGEGLDFWDKFIFDENNGTQIFRIEAMNEPFLSNESLLPNETLSYGEKIQAAHDYFHPKEKDLDPATNEYLIQGKVKILERLM